MKMNALRCRLWIPLAASLLLTGALVAPVLPAAYAAATPEAERVTASRLIGAPLPADTVRVMDDHVPASVSTILQNLVKAAGPGVRQGRSEVLAWTGNAYRTSGARRSALRLACSSRLKAAGWTYQEGNTETKERPFTVVTVERATPPHRGLIGVWIHADDTVVLAWTEILLAEAPPAAAPAAPVPPASTDTAPAATPPPVPAMPDNG